MAEKPTKTVRPEGRTKSSKTVKATPENPQVPEYVKIREEAIRNHLAAQD